jgi:hypothetical protein
LYFTFNVPICIGFSTQLGLGIKADAAGIGIPASLSGTGELRFWTGSLFSGAGLVQASTFLFLYQNQL